MSSKNKETPIYEST